MVGLFSSDEEKESGSQEDIDYEDMVWLTKKSVRKKLEKWRKEPTKPERALADKEESPLERSCENCYFCSHERKVNKIRYIRCVFQEPQWVVSQKDLSCWKSRT
ncbi:MAG: hypothetical protein EAX81_04680 [Candidatus Thorarchaeota archaeon]|nr:hypothetical protein [Candidatus Thorarchaeota archaeon]